VNTNINGLTPLNKSGHISGTFVPSYEKLLIALDQFDPPDGAA